MTTFLMSNHYINTSVQKAGIPGFPGYHKWYGTQYSQIKGTKQNYMWFGLILPIHTVPHHLIRMALEFFNFPSKVGEILMKYFNSAFMKFTVKNYTTKWQALEIDIMMSCVISPLLFVLAMELILRGAANTSKRVLKNEIWLFFLPELLWMTSPFSSRPKLLPMVYYKGIMTFTHGREWRLNQRKVEAYR